MKPPFILRAFRFLLTLAGDRNAFMYHFSDAIPQGRPIDPEHVLRLRRNYLMLDFVLFAFLGMVFVLGEAPLTKGLSLFLWLLAGYWLVKLKFNGIDKDTVAKKPSDDHVRRGLEEVLRDQPSLAPFIDASNARTAVSNFELALLMQWSMHEFRHQQLKSANR
ncbi:hypothetical protein [Acidovorax delafieldii]|uniref:hypothetical protein n=1 Tax=Acidovorax delafieldii TaxID=47920 RepID=UPI003ECF25E6